MTDDWEERANALPRGDLDAVLAFVREQFDRDGDISTELVHHLAMVSGVPDVAGRIERARARWFRALGRNVPAMPGPVGLE